jgi:hypothetical protein
LFSTIGTWFVPPRRSSDALSERVSEVLANGDAAGAGDDSFGDSGKASLGLAVSGGVTGDE